MFVFLFVNSSSSTHDYYPNLNFVIAILVYESGRLSTTALPTSLAAELFRVLPKSSISILYYFAMAVIHNDRNAK
jgi:hypothetical protein